MPVAPPQISSDGSFLHSVGRVVAAVKGEVAQCGELALNPVQPRGVAGRVVQLDPVSAAPVGDLGLGVGFVVVADQIQLPDGEAAAELFAEVEELRPPFAAPEPVEHLPRGQVQCGEHLPHSGMAVVGSA